MDIFAKIRLDTKDASTQLDQFGDKAEKVGKKAESGFNSTKLAITAVTGAVGYLVAAAAKSIDRIGKLNQQLGISTEYLGTLAYAADLSGTSLDAVANATAKLAKGIFDFATAGKGEGAAAFKQLGITAAALKPILNDSQAQLSLIADKFAGMENGAAKTTLAVKLFGESGKELIPLLNQGSEGIAEMEAEANALGQTLGVDAVRSVEGMNDSISNFSTGIGGLIKQIVAMNSGWVTEVFDWLTDKIKVIIGMYPLMVEHFEQMINDTVYGIKLIGFWFQGLGVRINHYWSTAIDGAQLKFAEFLAYLAQGAEKVSFLGGDAVARQLRSIESSIKTGVAVQVPLEEKLLQLEQDKVAAAREYLSIRSSIIGSVTTQTVGPSGSAGAGAGAAVDIIANYDKTAGKFAAMLNKAQEDVLTQEEQQIQAAALAAQNRIDVFNAALLTEQITDAEHKALMAANEDAFQKQITDIQKQNYDERAKFAAMSTQQQVNDVLGALTNMTSGVAQHNKKLFQLNKAAAIASAIVSTYEGATLALAKYPPPLSYAMAAAVVASGLAKVQAIKSTTFGTSSASGGAGGGVTPTVPSTVAQPVTSTGTGGTTYVNVTVLGSVTTEQGLASNVIDAIKERAASDEIIIDPDSANGLLLRSTY